MKKKIEFQPSRMQQFIWRGRPRVLLGVNSGQICPASAPPRGAGPALPRGVPRVARTARFRARDRPRPALGAPSPDGHVTARSQAAPPSARSANRKAPYKSRPPRCAE